MKSAKEIVDVVRDMVYWDSTCPIKDQLRLLKEIQKELQSEISALEEDLK